MKISKSVGRGLLALVDLGAQEKPWFLLWDLHINWGSSFSVGLLFWGQLIISLGMWRVEGKLHHKTGVCGRDTHSPGRVESFS